MNDAAIRSTSITEDGGVQVVTLAVESADLPGAVTVALSVARQSLSSLQIMSMTLKRWPELDEFDAAVAERQLDLMVAVQAR